MFTSLDTWTASCPRPPDVPLQEPHPDEIVVAPPRISAGVSYSLIRSVVEGSPKSGNSAGSRKAWMAEMRPSAISRTWIPKGLSTPVGPTGRYMEGDDEGQPDRLPGHRHLGWLLVGR